ncbi:MAG: aminopeptidase P family protein [Candidatus Dormibacteraeota bacterium]|nr:aminopeptidase P family protein [Candidatus Dormibacteraeota bacterium]
MGITRTSTHAVEKPPFDQARLDELLGGAGVDLVVASSPHNTRYLLGGYRHHFHERMPAGGRSSYLAAVGYPRERADAAFVVGRPGEREEQRRAGVWVPNVLDEGRSSAVVGEVVAREAARLGAGRGTIAVELPFLPADALLAIQQALPGAKLIDATPLLEELRIIKQPYELELLKKASERVVAAMLATYARAVPGMTTREVVALLQEEEAKRDLAFDYCLIATARSFFRAPSDDRWEVGQSISTDSGGSHQGYLGDLARMAVFGEPTELMRELLDEIDTAQQAARRPIRPGALYTEVNEAGAEALRKLPHREEIDFEAHGMGLVNHEAPHVELARPGDGQKLAAGMVLSIETTLKNREVGFVKLEDTVVVTETGWEAYGDTGRGWNVVG